MTLWVKGLLCTLLVGSSGGLIAGNYLIKSSENEAKESPITKVVSDNADNGSSADNRTKDTQRTQQDESPDSKDLETSRTKNSITGGSTENPDSDLKGNTLARWESVTL